MNNQEILNRFDVLYNNITSSQAPGLDGYEKSVFWNKATLEVLKNHLNPKGNKYGEGFDGSSKRQIEFSDLVVTKTFDLYPTTDYNGFGSTSTVLTTVTITTVSSDNTQPSEVAEKTCELVDYSDVLSILNENIEVCKAKDIDDYRSQIDMWCFGLAVAQDFNHDGEIGIADVSELLNYLFSISFIDDDTKRQVTTALISTIFDHQPRQLVLQNPKTIKEVRDVFQLNNTRWLTVVPINHVEYDTLMSRPYKHPPKPQAWRLLANGKTEVVVHPNEVPVTYRIRYVRIPTEVNLESDVNSEVPEVLHDEILQRAVELAKAAYVGDATQQQIIQTLGERSE